MSLGSVGGDKSGNASSASTRTGSRHRQDVGLEQAWDLDRVHEYEPLRG
jgi:hypothetical protein